MQAPKKGKGKAKLKSTFGSTRSQKSRRTETDEEREERRPGGRER